jgi:hypothetical protein
MKKVVSVLFVLSLAACAQPESGSKPVPSGSLGGNPTDAKAENKTDYGICGSAHGVHRLEGSWQLTQQDFRFTMTLDIYRDSVTLRNDCEFRGHEVSVETSAASYYDMTTLSVLSANQAHNEINEAGVNMDCDVSIKPMRVRYSFRGRCLVMSSPNSTEDLVMVPAYY